MKKLASYKDGLLGYDVELVVMPIGELEVIPVQRKASDIHVKRLAVSMKRVGYVAPVILIQRGKKNLIIDGQHRFLAAKSVGLKELPCVVVPEKFAHHLMELNVEKTMNLREKCYVALNVYRMYLDEESTMPENDARLVDSIEQGYYVTIGLTYEKQVRFSGSSFEILLKKVDLFTEKPLKDAVEERRRRSATMLKLHDLVGECVKKVQSLGISHPFLYKEVVSYANPYKRKRKVDDTFDGLFQKVEAALQDLRENPGKMRRHRFSADAEA